MAIDFSGSRASPNRDHGTAIGVAHRFGVHAVGCKHKHLVNVMSPIDFTANDGTGFTIAIYEAAARASRFFSKQ